jgi:probable HAF family extracellular repeat protein
MFRYCTMMIIVLSTCEADLMSATPSYTLTDLGEISGSEGTIRVNGINTRGDIVGSFGSSTTGGAFVWTSERGIQTLTVPGATRPSAEGINDFGQVVGYARLASQSNNHAFIWDSSGSSYDIVPTAVEAYAYDINNQGEVVGAEGGYGDRYPYIWTENDGMTRISNILGNANAISSNGKVTGDWRATISSSERAFRWESETGFCDIPGGGGWSRGNAINDNGWVVGFGLGNSSTIPMLWTPENGVEYIGGSSGGWGYGINNAGTALIATQGNWFLWNREEGLLSLNTLLVDLPSNWQLLSATTINDTGMIAGTAGINGNHPHLVLLTPIPEPSALILLGIGAISILPYAWHRRKHGA